MKIIRSKDVQSVPVADMRPGMIIAEGVVYEVDGDFCRVPMGVTHAGLDDTFEVYGSLGDDETRVYVEHMTGVPQ